MTQAPIDAHAEEQHGHLVSGACSLIFEGQSFVEDGAGERKYWLEVNHPTREELTKQLQQLGWEWEAQPFHATFWGSLHWSGCGHGHLSMFGGTAHLYELISVRYTPPPCVKRQFGSIAERLRQVRLPQSD